MDDQSAGAPTSVKVPERLTELREACLRRYGTREGFGWAPRRRVQFGYFLPSEMYETLLDVLIAPKCRWLDVGGGKDLLPENPALSEALAARCSIVVAVDPSKNVLQNRFAHDRVQVPIEQYAADQTFDIASLRMVAEHLSDPPAIARALHRLVRPGGLVVVLTVNRWSPVSLVARVTPFAWHHPIKKLFWGGPPEDTFPVQYRMNTPAALRRTFSGNAFRERLLARVADLSTFGLLKTLGYLELVSWRASSGLGVPYPEHCLLAVYEAIDPGSGRTTL